MYIVYIIYHFYLIILLFVVDCGAIARGARLHASPSVAISERNEDRMIYGALLR